MAPSFSFLFLFIVLLSWTEHGKLAGCLECFRLSWWLKRSIQEEMGWNSHWVPSDDLTAHSLFAWIWCHHCGLFYGWDVTVHSAALGSLTQCFHVTVTAVWLHCLHHLDARLQPSSSFSSPLPFVSVAVNDALLTATSLGPQPCSTISANVTLQLPLQLHSQCYAGFTEALFLSLSTHCYYLPLLLRPAFALVVYLYQLHSDPVPKTMRQ